LKNDLSRDASYMWLKENGFVGESKVKPQAPTFLIATSAGEVGIWRDDCSCSAS
jgi:hypothetical protein